MADFENGLPPDGLDVSDEKISSVFLDTQDVSQATDEKISSVSLSMSDTVAETSFMGFL